MVEEWTTTAYALSLFSTICQ